jgi:membrane protease YdiL (CAAX protease family)
MQKYHYRPILYFAVTYALTWIPWAIAAHFSFAEGQVALTQIFTFLGLFGPFVTALTLTLAARNKALREDFKDRLLNLRRVSPPFLLVTVFLMPCASYLAILVSVHFFGRSASQLNLIPGLVSWVPILLLAPTFEELGWRGYAMDSLRASMGMLPASLLFGVLWAVWHVPLVFINHTYQHDLTLMSPIYLVNFFVSVMPAAIIGNWLYYKHNRSIPAAILYHFMLDLIAISFAIDQFSKCLVTIFFLVFAALIIAIDRRFFLEGPRNYIGDEGPQRPRLASATIP